MSISRYLTRIFLLPCLALLAVSCSDGVGTTSNPNLSDGGSGYSGPAARTPDIRAFQTHFYNNLYTDNRCGQCHGVGQNPAFVDKADVNAAYIEAIQIVSLSNPGSSDVVAKARTGHHCWLFSANDCADTIESMIVNWASGSNITAGRPIQLTAPAHVDPGDAKSFPDLATDDGLTQSFADTVHPILVANCQNCHKDNASSAQAPFFANSDSASAYDAARPKMDIDTPANSRLVVRLREESHQCWTNDCAADAQTMQDAITVFANGILPTQVDPVLVTSKALNLGDGIIASGGNRHEADQIALWEFKSGLGSPEAIDTSGKTPEINLQLGGSYQWLGGYGLDLSNGGYAYSNNIASRKLKERIELTGEYAIEAWIIPANVAQAGATILGYSDGTPRNFSLDQEMYDYRFYNRVDDPDPLSLDGEPFYTTGDSGEEIAQASLQHVVANYDPFVGRTVYVNGALVMAADRGPASTSIGNVVWDDNYAFVIGAADAGGGNDWDGQVRLVAIHNRALTPAQIQQNFDLGVGAKFYLLFWVGHRVNPGDPNDQSYILVEVSQFDNYSYLFSNPMFINLDSTWTPTADIPIKGMRIGINGKEALVGQVFANIDVTVNAADYDYAQLGQNLSPLGTVIAVEKNVTSDEFFLTFETIGNVDRIPAFSEALPTPPIPPTLPPVPVVSDIGVRTFEEIAATISAITGVPVNDTRTFGNPVSVKGTYDSYIQQLPTVESIDAFLPSHQMAVAQLALASCNTLVETNPGYFASFNMSQNAQTAFGPPPPATYYNPPQPSGAPSAQQDANRAAITDPLLTAAMNVVGDLSPMNLTTQPDSVDVRGMLSSGATQDLDSALGGDAYESLVTEMLGCTPPPLPAVQECAPDNSVNRTRQIVKAVCAAAVGSAVMLVQ
ncbi:MAG: LamG domain-containing protein [Gammaproteobacteria bacterium]|nr:LamG domain-containing protein [Gammaproteobacteria bacterium]MDH3447426.1 LamG domain-containing protein [Gammaproteobacteria bacterium]